MKYLIDVDLKDIPSIDDYHIVGFRCVQAGDYFLTGDGDVIRSREHSDNTDRTPLGPRLILKRKQPRQIVFEEVTGELNPLEQYYYMTGDGSMLASAPSYFSGDTVKPFKVVSE